MKHKLTKTLAMLLAVLMVAMCMPMSFAADIVESGKCGENITWTLDSEGTMTISGEGEFCEDENGEWVEVFNRNKKIKHVVVEDGITGISDAFNSCYYLESVTIADSVTYIVGSFFGCFSLKEVKLSENLEYIYYSFFYNSCMKEITIPDSVKTIDTAFYLMTALETVNLSEGLEILSAAFLYCQNLRNITLPDSIKEIRGYTLMYTKIESLRIPASLEKITGAEEDWDEETGEYVDPPMAFLGNRNLKTITVAEGNENFCTDEYGALYNKDMTELYVYPCGSDNLRYILPETVTDLSGMPFSGAHNLKSIIVHDKVVTADCEGIALDMDIYFNFYLDENGEAVVENDSDLVAIPDFTLYGYAGTVTEASAKENGVHFVAIDGEHTAHDYILVNEEKPETCFDNTYKYYTCGYCLDSYVETIESDGHDVVIDPAVPAGKKTNGLTEGSHCGVCGEILVPQYETDPVYMGFVDMLIDFLGTLFSLIKNLFA